jgi:hypothetical protein
MLGAIVESLGQAVAAPAGQLAVAAALRLADRADRIEVVVEAREDDDRLGARQVLEDVGQQLGLVRRARPAELVCVAVGVAREAARRPARGAARRPSRWRR